ncbi:MAG TPA: acyltransferase [Acidimicrobiales bacterium]
MSTVTTPPAGTRKRLDHIDAMRPVKQAAVISTHALIFFAPLATSTAVVGLIMLTRFSRDAFLFVSACMLTYSYKDNQKIALVHYSKRRFLSVGVPYLTWTVIYFFYTSLTDVKGIPFYSFHSATILSVAGLHYFVHILLYGYYHLYYLIVIMEFYILFPLMMKFIRRFPQWHIQIMVFALVWQIAFGVLVSPHFSAFKISGVVQTRLITSYAIYIIGGMIVALHLDPIHEWICAKARWIVAVTIASALVAEVLNYFTRHGSLLPYFKTGTNIFSPAILPFNVGAILCVYLLGVYLVSPRRRERTRAMVKSGSDNSYGVYLSQMLWIPFLVRLRNSLGFHIPWPVAAPIALILVYFMGYIFTALMARTPLARAVTGRGQVSWSSLRPRHYESSRDTPDATVSPLDVATQ